MRTPNEHDRSHALVLNYKAFPDGGMGNFAKVCEVPRATPLYLNTVYHHGLADYYG